MRSWLSFLDRRFPIEETTKLPTSRLVHNSNLYWTWHVCPVELFSTQSCTSSLQLVLHMLASGTKTQRMKVSPILNEVQEEVPDSNPDGRALEAEPDGLEVEDLRWVLVRVDLTSWEIRLIDLIFMLWHYWLYISGIWRWTDSFISEY